MGIVKALTTALLPGLAVLILAAGCELVPPDVATKTATLTPPLDSDAIDEAIRATPGVEQTFTTAPFTYKFLFLIPYYTSPESHGFRSASNDGIGMVEHYSGSEKVKIRVSLVMAGRGRIKPFTQQEKESATELIDRILDSLRRAVSK